MQKNRKRPEIQNGIETRQRRNYDVTMLEVINIDDLSIMPDEDLAVRLRNLEDDKNRVQEQHIETRSWEEEASYIRREQQIRRARRDAHSNYIRKYEDEFNRLEASLPAGDFDNSAFVYAASGGRPRWS